MPGIWSKLYWTRIASPGRERPIFRAILGGQRRRILEVGVGDAARAEKMIRLAGDFGPTRYLGVDLFEGRSPEMSPGIPLKLALGRLSAIGAEVRLSPGDPSAALARLAGLRDNDLVVVASEFASDERTLWQAISAMTNDHSAVFVERDKAFERLSRDELRRLAGLADRVAA